MERKCSTCQAPFIIHPDEEAFLKKMTFIFGNTTVTPPLPIYCPDCRLKRRTCHRNERFLYKTRSAFSGKDTISIYAPEPLTGEPLTIYAQEEWRSDAWDPLKFGRSFDASRPFFEQVKDLQRAVPRMALITVANENSAFTTGTGYCKNCYLINSSEYCEDCYYGKLYQKCKNSVDCAYLYDSTLCYECFSCYGCYGCQYLSFSQNCQDCFMSSNLKSCSNCCLSENLDHKEYYFLNEPLSKKEYEERMQQFRGHASRFEEIKKLHLDRMQKMVRKYANIVNSENVSGDYIENSRNCLDCYDVNESEDCRYVTVGVNVKDNYDCSNMYLKPELCYETLGTIEVHTIAYCLFVFHSQRLLYCDYCFSCSDCFACSGLTRKKFCIFNMQYSEEEYNRLVPQIIEHMKKGGEWGLYFPPHVSNFGYNETLASEYLPLTKGEAHAQGFHWREGNNRDFQPQTIELPESITDALDSLPQEVLCCTSCKKNYRIIPQELAFYRQNIIPLPRRCPDCRYTDRLQLRNPRHLFTRTCSHCKKEVETTFASERPETIVCDECYRAAFY